MLRRTLLVLLRDAEEAASACPPPVANLNGLSPFDSTQLAGERVACSLYAPHVVRRRVVTYG